MPGATKKKKRSRGRKSVRKTAVTIEKPKLVTQAPKLESKSVEKQNEKVWFKPSVKGIDRDRPQPAPAASKRVPVITLYGVDSAMTLISFLKRQMDGDGEFYVKWHPDRVTLVIKKISNFIWSVNLFDKMSLQYHYKNFLEDRCKRYVLRGIPVGYEPEICSFFKDRGFIVHDVHRLIGPKSSLFDPVFILYHTQLPEGPEITGVRRLNKWMVKIEEYKGMKKEPLLCMRCCRYNHSATFCSAIPRCYKCAEAHEGSICRQTLVFKCCNCDGDHPAVARFCSMYTRMKEYNTKSREKKKRPGQPDTLVAKVSHIFQKFGLLPAPKKPLSRLPKLIAKSFVVVAWNARGADLSNCPQFFEFLESQGAHLACISEWKCLPPGQGHWNVFGSASAGLLVRADVHHDRLHLRPAVVSVRVQTKTNIGLRVAVAHVSNSESFVPDRVLKALPQGPADEEEPTVVLGDFSARHHAWNAAVNNKRGKTLNRAAQTYQLSTFGPKNPSRFYRDDQAPYVVMAKNIPVTPSIMPKRMQGTAGDDPSSHCPLVVHLRNWRKPKGSRRLDLPADIKEMIRVKNRIKHEWLSTKFSMYKTEMNRMRGEIKAKVDELRQSNAK